MYTSNVLKLFETILHLHTFQNSMHTAFVSGKTCTIYHSMHRFSIMNRKKTNDKLYTSYLEKEYWRKHYGEVKEEA